MIIAALNSSLETDEQLWNEWFETKDDEIANALIQKYVYLVNFHVDRIAFNLPNNVSRDDLFSMGLLGLYDALNRFEPERELKFDTYASFRIRGSIMDGLRKEDWLPRSLREKTKRIELVSQQLEQTLQRAPHAEEIAEAAGIDKVEVEEVVRDSLYANVLSIEKNVQDENNEQSDSLISRIQDDSLQALDEGLIHKELVVELVKHIKLLNQNEQLVISLFYHEELSMTEIGEVLDLTTSRISQIHKQAIFKLRKTLKKVQA
ncbi:FliA/WhiG family RNA polymerase sigma factor [Ornithinibacillus sp. 4-3]|uniref:RNA polymerase sigma factor n=1 Tax=Ornithinibacillus sp. 4-3 TaxID=3231488 RepID=A0AB39HU58_9BACI